MGEYTPDDNSEGMSYLFNKGRQMTEKGKLRSFYMTAYTGRGFYSFAESALAGVEHLFVLRAKSGRAKTRVIEQVSQALVERGYDVELFHSPWGDGLLEGLITPALKMAIVDEPVCGVGIPRGRGEVIDLGAFCDPQQLRSHQAEVKDAEAGASELVEQGSALFVKSLELHNQIETHYGRGLDFAKADEMAEELVKDIFGSEPQVRDLFVAGLGIVEDQHTFYRDLIASCRRRYIIKGAPGTGKSVLVKKVAEAAAERGYRVDMIHCLFDPQSIDMVFIPELSVIIVDGTPPHVIEPQSPRDKVIDMLQCVELQAVGEQAEEEALWERLKNTKGRRRKCFLEAKKMRDTLEAYYADAMDWEEVKRVARTIVDKTA